MDNGEKMFIDLQNANPKTNFKRLSDSIPCSFDKLGNNNNSYLLWAAYYVPGNVLLLTSLHFSQQFYEVVTILQTRNLRLSEKVKT